MKTINDRYFCSLRLCSAAPTGEICVHYRRRRASCGAAGRGERVGGGGGGLMLLLHHEGATGL